MQQNVRAGPPLKNRSAHLIIIDLTFSVFDIALRIHVKKAKSRQTMLKLKTHKLNINLVLRERWISFDVMDNQTRSLNNYVLIIFTFQE